jgi:hypothetical protein
VRWVMPKSWDKTVYILYSCVLCTKDH